MAKKNGVKEQSEIGHFERFQDDHAAAESVVAIDSNREALRDGEQKIKEIARNQERAADHEDSRLLGILQKINFDNIQNELLKYATLYTAKKNKTYRKGGMTWAEFCQAFGEPVRSVDEKLKDIGPIIDNFSASYSNLLNIPFNKIRYLGREISAESANIENGCIIIDGVSIPLSVENKDDIEALIDSLKETHAKERKNLSIKVKNLEKTRNKIISEATKGLQIEREALIKENQRLKAFDPEEKDNTWSLQQMEAIETLALDLNVACRRFLVDKRLKDDCELRIAIQTKMNIAIGCLTNLETDWYAEFNTDEE